MRVTRVATAQPAVSSDDDGQGAVVCVCYRRILFPQDRNIFPQRCKKLTHAWRQIVGFVGKQLGQLRLEGAHAMSDGNSKLDAKCSCLIGQLSLACHQTFTYALHHLYLDLFDGFGPDKRMLGRLTASAIATASMRSFLLDLTYGLKNWAGMMRIVWPSPCSFLASHGTHGQASMPITAGVALAKNIKMVARLRVTRWS